MAKTKRYSELSDCHSGIVCPLRQYRVLQVLAVCVTHRMKTSPHYFLHQRKNSPPPQKPKCPQQTPLDGRPCVRLRQFIERVTGGQQRHQRDAGDGAIAKRATMPAVLSGCRVVVGVGRRTLCCQGRRAAASGFKREVTINMLLGWACGKARGGGGGTASATAAVGSNVPRASRSAAAAFFARMDVRRRQWRGRRCYRAGGYESRCWTARLEGGGRATRSVFVATEDEDEDDGWDLPPPPARRRWMRRCRCPLRPTTETTKTHREGGGATTRDKRQATTARQGATLRSSRHGGGEVW